MWPLFLIHGHSFSHMAIVSHTWSYSFQSKLPAPGAAVVEAIATSSSGDVRAAINTLQFACRTGMYNKHLQIGLTKRCLKFSQELAITLFLYNICTPAGHLSGKIPQISILQK